MNCIDAHTHTYLRGVEELKSMAGAGITHAVVCAFFPVSTTSAATLLELFRWLDLSERSRLRQAGVTPILAVGIHPRSLPPENETEAVLSGIQNLAEAGRALAIGEIGLETGSDQESRVLLSQLLLAKNLGIPAVIHTPRSDKAIRLRQTLEIAARSGIPAELLIIDHLTPELIGEVKKFNSRTRIGMTIQPGKTTPSDVLRAAAEHGISRMHLDSDLSNAPSSPCAVAECAQELRREGMSERDVRALAFENAAEAFGITEKESASLGAAL